MAGIGRRPCFGHYDRESLICTVFCKKKKPGCRASTQEKAKRKGGKVDDGAK